MYYWLKKRIFHLKRPHLHPSLSKKAHGCEGFVDTVIHHSWRFENNSENAQKTLVETSESVRRNTDLQLFQLAGASTSLTILNMFKKGRTPKMRNSTGIEEMGADVAETTTTDIPPLTQR